MEKKYTILIAAAIVAFAAGVSGLIVSSNSSSGNQGGVTGLSETKGPWQPEYTGLTTRIRELRIPAPGTEKYHVHARLAIYAEGQKLPVPTNIGLTSGALSALHTHDDTGLMHIEADAPFEVKLSDFFTIWGVKFTDTQVGGYKNDETKTLQVFVNGKKVDSPANYVVQAKDTIIVGHGTPDSFPTNDTSPFPE